MNKRNLLATCGAALLALITSPPQAPAMPVVRPTLKRARAVRELLLPGLWARNREYPHIELNIYVSTEHYDGVRDNLIVSGYNAKTGALLGFAITQASMEDGSFKAQFNPSVQALLRMVDQAFPFDGGIISPPNPTRT